MPRNIAGLLTVTYMFGSGAPPPFWQPREAGWEGREVKNGLCDCVSGRNICFLGLRIVEFLKRALALLPGHPKQSKRK